MATKRTYQPSKTKRARTHGFLVRSRTKGGRRVLARRRAKGRHVLALRLIAVVSGSQAKNFRLPRAFRIISTEDFGVILRTRNEHSFRVHSACFVAGCLENEQTGVVRIGVTVGKKNAPLSVDRAIVKRQLREIFRLHLPMLRQVLPDGVGLDVSLRLKVPLKGLSPKSRTDLKRRLRADADGLLNEVIRRSKRRTQAKAEQQA